VDTLLQKKEGKKAGKREKLEKEGQSLHLYILFPRRVKQTVGTRIQKTESVIGGAGQPGPLEACLKQHRRATVDARFTLKQRQERSPAPSLARAFSCSVGANVPEGQEE